MQDTFLDFPTQVLHLYHPMSVGCKLGIGYPSSFIATFLLRQCQMFLCLCFAGIMLCIFRQTGFWLSAIWWEDVFHAWVSATLMNSLRIAWFWSYFISFDSSILDLSHACGWKYGAWKFKLMHSTMENKTRSPSVDLFSLSVIKSSCPAACMMGS